MGIWDRTAPILHGDSLGRKFLPLLRHAQELERIISMNQMELITPDFSLCTFH